MSIRDAQLVPLVCTDTPQPAQWTSFTWRREAGLPAQHQRNTGAQRVRVGTQLLQRMSGDVERGAVAKAEVIEEVDSHEAQPGEHLGPEAGR